MAKLYAFDGVGNIARGDPHAIVITLSDADARRLAVHRERELDLYLGRYDVGPWLEVADADTGERYRVASAPCGLGCRCAAVAEKLAA